MTTLEPTAPTVLPMRFAPALFAATIFLSALLLFLVQPMFTKMVLPRLGGAPQVWSVAMVFFQAGLLAGYGYAHLLVRRLSPGTGALVHLGVLAAAAACLPIAVAQGFGAPPTSGIALWLIGLFAVSIGLPFAVLSASAPLLQGWFATTGHPQAHNPYVLYAASNLGSFAALLAYPAVIEPLLSLKTQSLLWSAGFTILCVSIAVASLLVARQPMLGAADPGAEPVSLRDRLAWLALAAVPAGLVIAVTSYVTTDVAAAPFLWVIPLAIYLLTFVAVFRERPWITHETLASLAPIAVAPLSIALMGGGKLFWLVMIMLIVASFGVLALLCHGELYRRRPAPSRLTEFYLWCSLGGVIGGIFAALVAPNIFNRIYEYPILIAAAVLVLPGMFAGGVRQFTRDAAPILAVAAVAVAVKLTFDIHLPAAAALPLQIALVTLAAAIVLQRRRPARLFALVVLAFVVSALWQPGLKGVMTARSFFGVHQVVETADGRYRLLSHGTTLHGAERIVDRGAAAPMPPEPLTYYYFGGPISDGIEAVRTARGGLHHVAVVGLGTGSLACHKRSDEQWAFFEIDPDVVRIARDQRLFSFISACAPDLAVILGDARLTLTASQQRYDLIVLDAFSSDAIPAHLLTREALAGYLSRLEPGGALLLHISNRHMDLAPVVAAVGAAEGLVTWLKQDDRPDDQQALDFKTNAIVAALARSTSDLGDLPQRPGWREVKPEASVPAWTDDYSDLLGAILRRKFGR
jgi:hypothetical protein